MITYFILGSVFASFMYQLTSMDKINLKSIFDRSKCQSCHKRLHIIDLIPIISFICLKGKCRFCKCTIPRDLFYVELCLAVLFALPFLLHTSVNLTLYYYLIFFLIPLSIYDIFNWIIPNHMLLIMIFTMVIIFDVQNLNITYGWLMIGVLHLIYFLSKGGIGYGDIKLFSILSVLLSVNQFLFTFMLSFMTSGIYVLLYVLITKRQISKVPLVPFITIAMLIVLFLNQQFEQYFLGGYYGY